MLDVKEKKGPLPDRWHLLAGVNEPDLFVIDELSVRKAASFWPGAFFLVHDRPGERYVLVWIVHLLMADVRARINRNRKGKWVINLADFIPVKGVPEADRCAKNLLVSCEWKRSSCMELGNEIGEI